MELLVCWWALRLRKPLTPLPLDLVAVEFASLRQLI
jgi:hypothetical protein